MFPFAGGLLGGKSRELLVPGQDSPATFTDFAGWPDTAYAGFRFDINGNLMRRFGNTYLVWNANSWIHGDSKAIVDASLYEVRFHQVTGDTSWLVTPGGAWSSGNDGTFYPLTSNRLWYLYASGPQFGFSFHEVQGLIQIREIANTSNVRTGNLTLRASYEGQL